MSKDEQKHHLIDHVSQLQGGAACMKSNFPLKHKQSNQGIPWEQGNWGIQRRGTVLMSETFQDRNVHMHF